LFIFIDGKERRESKKREIGKRVRKQETRSSLKNIIIFNL